MAKRFTGKKKKCIDLLATGEMTQLEIAEQLHVHNATISRWKQDDSFMAAVVRKTQKLLKNEMPDVLKALKEKAKQGSSNHIRMYLEHLEKLEAIRANKQSVTFTWESTTTTGGDSDE